MKKMMVYLLILIFIFGLYQITRAEEDYHNSFRNPFSNYESENQEEEKKLTIKEVKAGVPFNLTGIMESDNNRVAIVQTPEGTEFIKNRFEFNNYYITGISPEMISIRFKEFSLKMKIGGEIVEK